MGVLLFVGIKSVGPNIEKTTNAFVKENNVSDLQIVSTAGITTADKELVESIGDTKGELGYSFPYVEENNDLNLQIYSYDKKGQQNKLRVTDGRMPETNKEIVLDSILKDDYKMGETIELKDDTLKEQKVKIVGFVESPLYIENSSRGNTTVGDGQLDGFLYSPIENFDSSAYSILYVRFGHQQTQDIFSEVYKNSSTQKTNDLEDLFEDRKSERRQEIVDEAMEDVEKNQDDLDENKDELTQEQTKLDDAKKELDAKKQQLAEQREQLVAAYGEEIANQQLADPQNQLDEAEQELSNQQKELNGNLQKIQEGQDEIDDAIKEINDIKEPNYIFTDRISNPGYEQFTSLSDRIDAIGNIFPVFFFFIAILITFTTITRMIEENRKEIGTLKALGYRNTEISSKYILYASLTAVIGTTVGILVGTKGLPPIVFTMLRRMFIFRTYPTNYWLLPIVIAIFAALLATLGSSLLVLFRELREKPAELLVARAPKAGKRVFLERITPLWRHFSFNQKVTARNLLRYKSQMILTILGIAGCTGLMLAGFGLNDSIGAPAEQQFEKLHHYQAIVTLEEEKKANEDSKVGQTLSKEKQVTDQLPIYNEQVTFKGDNISNQSASLTVTSQKEKFSDYVKIVSKSKNSKTELNDEGAIVSQRLAKIFDVSVGQTLTMSDSSGNDYELKVTGITENYLGHNVYMTNAYYEQVTGEAPQENTFFIKTTSLTSDEESQLAKTLQETGDVINTTYMSDQLEQQENATSSMQPVVLIFIILSGTLAFVVLYNLTNINISERERELATIKVLGFYNKEVTNYIVRENVVFTFFGILFGFGIGYILTWFIAEMASSDMLVFPVVVPGIGYVVSAIMTFVFSGIVMIITHFKLKGINMIEALSSNE